LDNPVANANELALFINFVRQEPTTAYTASGTSLTLTSATSASDDMYCVFLGKAVQTVNPPSGSVGISQLSATGTKDSTTFLRGDNTFASAGGANTPAFEASLSADQSISNDVSTKVQFNTELYDTDSAYDNSTNYRFTPQTAGKYYVYFKVELYGGSTNNLHTTFLQIKKNGSTEINSEFSAFPDNILHKIFIYNAGIVEMNGSTDYVEAFAIGTGGNATQTVKSPNRTSLFGAYKIIE
jgi:hypothetical protein